MGELGPEQPSGAGSDVGDGSVDLGSHLARVGSIPANTDVIDAALRLVTTLATETVEGAAGVSVTLERHGKMTTVAASNDTILEMDAHQYETGEGPCLAAAAKGRWFHIESVAEEDRWPSFTPRALEQGIGSVLSSPLMTADRTLGALNIYGSSERAFGPRQQELAELFAAQASAILVDARVDVTEEKMAEHIAGALGSRQTIAWAQGVLMAQQHLTAEDAAALLFRSARHAEMPVLRRASEIVASVQPGLQDA